MPIITDVLVLHPICHRDHLDTRQNAGIGERARLLRTMWGFHDQAARAATSP